MDILEIISAVGVVCSIFFSAIAFLNSQKKEIKQLGASEKNINNLTQEVNELKKQNEELEKRFTKEISNLNTKLDAEVKDLKKTIDKQNETNNNYFMNITKILSTLQAEMSFIKKKL